MNNHQLINSDSGDQEYYTDRLIIEAARNTMGSINLDPASSLRANSLIRADNIYTKQDDGLSMDWFGNVWMNHPFGRKENPLWINKLVSEYYKQNIEQAMCICFAATSEGWFRPLHQFPQCYLIPRTNYYKPDGTKKVGVTKGSVVTYLGENIDRFAKEFERLGEIKVPYSYLRR